MEDGRMTQCVGDATVKQAGRRVVKPGVALQEARELCANKGLGR